MGKKKQRKGAPDLDDDFPEPSEAATTFDTDTVDIPAAATKKQDKKKKGKKVMLTSSDYVAAVHAVTVEFNAN